MRPRAASRDADCQFGPGAISKWRAPPGVGAHATDTGRSPLELANQVDIERILEVEHELTPYESLHRGGHGVLVAKVVVEACADGRVVVRGALVVVVPLFRGPVVRAGETLALLADAERLDGPLVAQEVA